MEKFFILLVGFLVLSPFITLRSFAADKAAAPSKAVDPHQKTFEAKCSTCHGKDGKGKAAMAPVFKVPATALDLTRRYAQAKGDEKIDAAILAENIAIITTGKNKMPAYGKQLTPEAIKGLGIYIHSLAPKSK